MTATSQSRRGDPAVAFPWLTVEITLWGLLLIIALGLRLTRLSAAPLNADEARDALAAWRFASGQGAPTATGYSPALLSIQWLTFLIFGASDVTARLLPALTGAALALTPALLRKQLGRPAALAAGGLLTLSPTALTLSRTASGDILVALGAMLCVGGLWHFIDGKQANEPINTEHPPPNSQYALRRTKPIHRRAPTVYLAPIGLAVMLASGSLAYSALFTMASALLLTAAVDSESREWLQRGWNILRTTPNMVAYALSLLLISAVLFSTAFAWHFGGLGAAAALFSQWLDDFVRWPDSPRFSYPGLILVFYEPLTLFLGGVSLALVAFRRNPETLFLSLWSVLALALALIRPGHGPGDVVLVLLPLACLGGLTCFALIKGLRRACHWLNEGLFLTVSGVLWAYLLLNLGIYSSRPAQYTQLDLLFIILSLPTFLILGMATALLLLVLAVTIGLVQGSESALRGLAISALFPLLLLTIGTAVGVSQNRPADPRELLVLKPTATELRLLKESLTRLSLERQGSAYGTDLTVLTDDSALAWVLRDFQEAHFTDAVDAPASTSAVVAPYIPGSPLLGEEYVGQTFPLRRRWRPDSLKCRFDRVQLGLDQVHQLDCSTLMQWFLYRRGPERPLEEYVVLWLRQDVFSSK